MCIKDVRSAFHGLMVYCGSLVITSRGLCFLELCFFIYSEDVVRLYVNAHTVPDIVRCLAVAASSCNIIQPFKNDPHRILIIVKRVPLCTIMINEKIECKVVCRIFTSCFKKYRKDWKEMHKMGIITQIFVPLSHIYRY